MIEFGDDRLPPRFWEKVEVGKEAGCWLWVAGRATNGYSRFTVVHGDTRYAHRVAWTELVGEIPANLHIDHLCRVRHCVNPNHLEPVTPRENLTRGTGTTGRTHCQFGHELVQIKRQKYCRPCAATYQAAYRRRTTPK